MTFLPTTQNGVRFTTLPERQLDVWIGIATGQTTKGIALMLGISSKTVEYHRAKLMRRLKIWDVAGLTRAAIRNKLIEA